MEIIKNLFGNKGYIDGITIINEEGEILFSVKFNNKLNKNTQEYEIVGKNFYEIYENLTKNKSSLYKAMELEAPIYVKNQKLKPKGQNEIQISSLSIPIKIGNKIVGGIDLSREEVKNEDIKYENIEKEIDRLKHIQLESLQLDKSGAKYTLENIVTNNIEMKKLKELVKSLSNSKLPVMIFGETGTGKELFAQAIHNESKRKNSIFIAQNCAAIPESLLESIFFGTVKGAFTGAVDAPGLLETANGGTIFLDEINLMPLNLQSKLLRAIQENKIRRIGSKETIDIDIKLIAALNKEPLKAIEDKELRADLYYRISVLNLNIPPLRERKDDIPILVKFFVAKYNDLLEKNVKTISCEIFDILSKYNWPGNIRELEHIIAFGMNMISEDNDTLEFSHIESKWNTLQVIQKKEELENLNYNLGLKKLVEEYEKQIIEKILGECSHNISKAANILKVPRQTLQRKVSIYKI